MTSRTLSNFINAHLIDPKTDTYRTGNFTITNNGEMIDGNITHDTFKGGKLCDIIFANGGNDIVFGNESRDLLNGGAGNDSMYGGTGNDRLEGRDDADKLYGDAGKDELFGGKGNDHLYGGEGNDYLCAGSDRDLLWGGAGADLFVFRPELSAPKSSSTYKDFQAGVDLLKIDADLMPNGFNQSMIKVQADGDLYITTAGGHQMIFETLDRGDIGTLYNSINLI